MPLVALVTSSKFPNLTADDRLLLAPLAERGIHAKPAIWDDPTATWSSYDGIILRSTWDYHLKTEKFLRSIDALEDTTAPLWNPPALIRWNANKTYLQALDSKGGAVVPTIWPEAGDRANLRERLQEQGWQQAVVKPLISATAYRTQLVTLENAGTAQALFEELREGPGVMVQRFMNSVVDEGGRSSFSIACSATRSSRLR